MNINLDKIIGKINRLRQLSTSSNAHEAAAAAAIANALLEQHRFSEADLELKGEKAEEPIEEDTDSVYETNRITPYKDFLLSTLAKHYGVFCYRFISRPNNGRRFTSYRLVGSKSDIQIIKYMFVWLLSEAARLALQEVKGQGRVAVQSYFHGFVLGIQQQLQTSRQAVNQRVNNSAALLKINSRLQKAEDLVNLTTKLTDRKPGLMYISNRHLQAGKVQGENLHLGSTINGSNTDIKLLNK